MKNSPRKSFLSLLTFFSIFAGSFLLGNTAKADSFTMPPSLPIIINGITMTDYSVYSDANTGVCILWLYNSSARYAGSSGTSTFGYGNIKNAYNAGGSIRVSATDYNIAQYSSHTGGCAIGNIDTSSMNIDNTPQNSSYTDTGDATYMILNPKGEFNSSRSFEYPNGIVYKAPQSSITAIISQNPANGFVATSSSTTFSFTYALDCSEISKYDLASVQLFDLDNGNTIVNAPSKQIASCGTNSVNSYTATVALPNDNFNWRPILYNSQSSPNSSNSFFGDYYVLQSTSTQLTLANYTVKSTFGTSSLPSTGNLLSFLNVPTLLSTKVPFAYIFQIASGIQEGIESSSTNLIPPGTLVVAALGAGRSTTTFDFFSTSTVGYYLSPSLIALWRALLVVILFVGFGFALYNVARHNLKI